MKNKLLFILFIFITYNTAFAVDAVVDMSSG